MSFISQIKTPNVFNFITIAWYLVIATLVKLYKLMYVPHLTHMYNIFFDIIVQPNLKKRW
jgi:hypothetical protein